uniref:NADH-ubiquinone oxidoreductase chain 2 n=1 Tax=Anoplodactylus australis TaxID=2992006 RepID=A0A9E8AE78_9CHEL|nr:NADH dehydrogenase subunit 2 [Anoplodactylus australis]UZA61235.1 NADH dehydrogenase subunit 2 [Anoplodactylus australis]
MKFYYIMNFNLIFTSMIWALSSTSWFSLWLLMEINSLMFFPLMTIKMNQKSSEAVFKFFLVQSFSSLLIIFSISFNYFQLMLFSSINIYTMILMLSLLMKLGFFPFILWYINILSEVSYTIIFFILTLQKIIPLYFISLILDKNNLFYFSFFVTMNCLITVLMVFSQTKIKKIIIFSSSIQMSWLMLSMIFNISFFFIFFLFYTTLMYSIIKFLDFYNLNYLNQVYAVKNIYFNFTLMILAGFPPFSGFILKWMTLFYLTSYHYWFLSFVLLVSSIANLLFYSRLMFSSIFYSAPINKWAKNLLYPYNSLFIINFLMPIFLSMFIS